jgi:predicted Fe-Mo cluster-binding NifX family protein
MSKYNDNEIMHVKLKGEGIMKIALPVSGGQLSLNAATCQRLYIYDLQDGSTELLKVAALNSLPNDPGLLPDLLGEKGVAILFVQEMDAAARELFRQKGIKVVKGFPSSEGGIEDIIRQNLSGS